MVTLTSLRLTNQFTTVSLYLLMCHIANSDILRFVVDGVEGFVGLQAEGGDGEQDEEERSKCHVLQRETKREQGEKCYSLHIQHTSSHFAQVTLWGTVTPAHEHLPGCFKPLSLVFCCSHDCCWWRSCLGHCSM